MRLEKKIKINSGKIVDDIEKARVEANTVEFYIKHLERRDFIEVREEYWEGHPEELLDIAIQIVFNRRDKDLNKDILYRIDYIKSPYSTATKTA